jgi:hypothetical protein
MDGDSPFLLTYKTQEKTPREKYPPGKNSSNGCFFSSEYPRAVDLCCARNERNFEFYFFLP